MITAMKANWIHIFRIPACLGLGLGSLHAGPYSLGLNDSLNAHDAPIPGFTGPDGIGKSRSQTGFDGNGNPVFRNPNNRVNPLFSAWADDVSDYFRSDGDTAYNDPDLSLGPVTGDAFDVVSLGDLTSTQIANGNTPGSITLHFTRPIKNLSGADFVVFENGFLAQSNQGGAGIGTILGELAYVEVSADGVNFTRFPSASLTPAAVGPYGTIDPTNIYQLAGKHVNAGGESWGTPFDLAAVGMTEISYVRLVDIPGNGAFKDTANRSIYDAWRTFGSGGFDVEAVGSLSTRMTFAEWPSLSELTPETRGPLADPDSDGLPNLLEYAFATNPSRPDPAATQQQLVADAGNSFLEIIFTRDERPSDLTYEVQASGDLDHWVTIARSSAGGAMTGVDGFTPVITDTSASKISGIGVLREMRVRDVQPASAGSRRFLRTKVIRIP